MKMAAKVTNKRAVALAIFAALTSLASSSTRGQDEWTVTNMHPSGWTWSLALGTSGSEQVGYVYNGFSLAVLWSGAGGSWISLHPAGASESWANATSGTQ